VDDRHVGRGPRPAWSGRNTPGRHPRSGLQLAAGGDPDCLRANLDVINVLRTPDDVLADPVIAGRARAAFAGRRDAPAFGPSRAELVAMAHS
jgi:hypothetical protein